MAKKAATARVFHLARELGVDSKDIVAKCAAEDVPDIKNHMSTVKAGLAATIREWFTEGGVATAVETAEAVDIATVRAKARKRPSRKKAKTAEHEEPAVEVVEEAPPKATPTKRATQARKAAEVVTESPAEVEAEPMKLEPVERPAAAARVEPPISEPTESEPPPSKPVAPIMNIPLRPDVVSPAGPQLEKPTKTKLTGPKIIRVETPDIIAAPRPRGQRTAAPMGRGGPRAGRGVESLPVDMPESAPVRRRSDRGVSSSRRNKRRSASAFDESSRPARPAPGTPEPERPFNWREQDLLERENRLNRAGGFFRAARRDNLKRTTGGGQRAAVPAEVGGKVKVEVPIQVKDLSAATGVKVNDIIKKLFLAGNPVTVNSVLDAATATEALIDYNIELEIVELKTAAEQITEKSVDRDITDERPRSPVITILGHVDHGKTSLLDRIRNERVAEGEAGGITQATSAFRVPVRVGDEDRIVTFIDTPGHEAFTAMRARGARVTDLVVLVIAADDGVMPQTVESINHTKAAGVPIVVALNKIDKPEATESNIHRILGQLAEHELNPVEWGGSTEVVRTSATQDQGIQELLEVLDFQSQLLEVKADFGGPAEGTVLEASMKEGRGAVANILIQQGQLKKGDFIVAGPSFGRVRDIVDDRGQRLDISGPSTPVAVSGLNDVPGAGDKFYVVSSLKEAEAAASERIDVQRQRDLSREKITLDNVLAHMSDSAKKELPLIVKGDVQGSVETLQSVLGKTSTEDINVTVKHCAVGGVNDSDIALAHATGAVILGFNVTASASARRAAEVAGVDVRFYDVIYDLTDDITKAVVGMLEPELKLEVLGHADVRQVFRISRVGMIAGCYVTDGVIERNSQIRVTRDGIVVESDRRLSQLKRFKDDVKEVRAGQECGMNIDGYDDIHAGDVLECYRTKEVKRTH